MKVKSPKELEIIFTVRTVKDRRSPGEDSILLVTFKSRLLILLDSLSISFCRILDTELSKDTGKLPSYLMHRKKCQGNLRELQEYRLHQSSC